MTNWMLTVVVLVHILMTSVGNIGQQNTINDLQELVYSQDRAISTNQDTLIAVGEVVLAHEDRLNSHRDAIETNQRGLNVLLDIEVNK